MDKTLLGLLVWLLFLGGLFGMAMGMARFFGGSSPAEYGIMGIGGGFYLLASAIVIYIRHRVAGPAAA
jgi:hypothetical protein